MRPQIFIKRSKMKNIFVFSKSELHKIVNRIENAVRAHSSFVLSFPEPVVGP